MCCPLQIQNLEALLKSSRQTEAVRAASLEATQRAIKHLQVCSVVAWRGCGGVAGLVRCSCVVVAFVSVCVRHDNEWRMCHVCR